MMMMKAPSCTRDRDDDVVFIMSVSLSRRWIGNGDRRNRKGILEVLPVLLALRGFLNLIQLGKMEKKNGFLLLFNLLFFAQIGVDDRFRARRRRAAGLVARLTERDRIWS